MNITLELIEKRLLNHLSHDHIIYPKYLLLDNANYQTFVNYLQVIEKDVDVTQIPTIRTIFVAGYAIQILEVNFYKDLFEFL